MCQLVVAMLTSKLIRCFSNRLRGNTCLPLGSLQRHRSLMIVFFSTNVLTTSSRMRYWCSTSSHIYTVPHTALPSQVLTRYLARQGLPSLPRRGQLTSIPKAVSLYLRFKFKFKSAIILPSSVSRGSSLDPARPIPRGGRSSNAWSINSNFHPHCHAALLTVTATSAGSARSVRKRQAAWSIQPTRIKSFGQCRVKSTTRAEALRTCAYVSFSLMTLRTRMTQLRTSHTKDSKELCRLRVLVYPYSIAFLIQYKSYNVATAPKSQGEGLGCNSLTMS